jgi:iron complex outermembrane receptor protein
LLKQGTLDFQTAYIDKKYGANAFYSLKYPDQYEATKTFLSSLRWIGTKRFALGKHQASIVYIPSVYYRNNQDCFELVKGQSINKNNYHRTQVLGGNFLLAFRPNEWMQTSLSVSTREEDIVSTSLGEQLYHPIESKIDSIFYKYRKTRNESNVTMSQSFDYKGWSGAATFMLEHFSDLSEKIHFLPSVYLKYTLSQRKENYQHQEYLFLSASDAVRMPTFTDLYYKTGDIRGNKNLLPEKALNSELGFEWNMSTDKKRFLAAKGVFFYRWGRNMIDYVKKEGENMWNTVNHTQVNFTGVEVSAQYLPNKHLSPHFFIHSIQIQYTYIHSDKESMGYQSRYVLDHLTHHFLLQLNHKIIKGLELDYAFSVNKRKGEYTSYKENPAGSSLPYPAYCLLDLRLRYTYKVATFYVEASNVLNVKYFDIGDLEQSGIWAKAGVSVSL